MKKIVVIIFVLIGLVSLYKLMSTNPSNTGALDNVADLTLFWGQGCPHCEKVKEYIKSNNLDAKVKIALKEVYYNKTNQQLLEEAVKKCPEIDTKQGIGVPLAVVKNTNQCLYGDQSIIDWLSQK
jgi:glutaredoxin